MIGLFRCRATRDIAPPAMELKQGRRLGVRVATNLLITGCLVSNSMSCFLVHVN